MRIRRPWLALVSVLFIVCVALPVLVVRGCHFQDPPRVERPPGIGPFVQLRVTASGTLKQLDLEEYVKGVVAAEMPALFHLEALKAQAVLARTYIVTRMRIFGGPGDPDHHLADISDDPARGQAWLSAEALRQRWGPDFAVNWSKIERAVAETAGLIALYGGDPIVAAYHSTCGGRTESSGDVWQASLPYLQPVICEWDSHSPRFETRTVVSWSQIETALGPQAGAIAAAAASGRSDIIRVLTRTTGGRVGQVSAGDLITTGLDLRRLLAFPSTNFSVSQSAGGLTFVHRGFGHGVGMCQYGADGLAREGTSYYDILSHYMSGIALRHLFEH